MNNLAGRIARRLHQFFEAVGLASMTLVIGAKRAGQEHLQTHRVVTGTMVVCSVLFSTTIGLGLAAGGAAMLGVIGSAAGTLFLGAFLGMAIGLVLRVVVSAQSDEASTREAAEQKKTK